MWSGSVASRRLHGGFTAEMWSGSVASRAASRVREREAHKEGWPRCGLDRWLQGGFTTASRRRQGGGDGVEPEKGKPRLALVLQIESGNELGKNRRGWAYKAEAEGFAGI